MILKNDKLFYFNDKPPAGSNAAPAGVIWLTNSVVVVPEFTQYPVQPGQFPFQVQTKSRTYDIAASSEEERRQWLVALLTAIQAVGRLVAEAANFSWAALPLSTVSFPQPNASQAAPDYVRHTPAELRAQAGESLAYFQAKVATDFANMPSNGYFEALTVKPVLTDPPIKVTVKDQEHSVELLCDPATQVHELYRRLHPNAPGRSACFRLLGTSEYVLDPATPVLGLRTVLRQAAEGEPVVFELRQRAEIATPTAPELRPLAPAHNLPQAPCNVISHRLVEKFFSIKVVCLEGFQADRLFAFYDRDVVQKQAVQLVAEVAICQGIEILGTALTKTSPNGMWADTLVFSKLEIRNLPVSAKLLITVWAAPEQTANFSYATSLTTFLQHVAKPVIQAKPLGFVALPLFDYLGRLPTGVRSVPLAFDGEQGNPIALSSLDLPSDLQLHLEFENPPHPVYYEPVHPSLDPRALSAPLLSDAAKARLHLVLTQDPLTVLSREEKGLVWAGRDYCRQEVPAALRFVVMSVNWVDGREAATFHALLQDWPPINPLDCLELLDAQCSDPYVRLFALKCLRSLPNDDLQLYLLQLVQVLKAESHLLNPLVYFLLHRACLSRRIAEQLFHLVYAELQTPKYRYVSPSDAVGDFALLEALLGVVGASTRAALLQQLALTSSLSHIARLVRAAQPADRQELFHRLALGVALEFFPGGSPARVPSPTPTPTPAPGPTPVVVLSHPPRPQPKPQQPQPQPRPQPQPQAPRPTRVEPVQPQPPAKKRALPAPGLSFSTERPVVPLRDTRGLSGGLAPPKPARTRVSLPPKPSPSLFEPPSSVVATAPFDSTAPPLPAHPGLAQAPFQAPVPAQAGPTNPLVIPSRPPKATTPEPVRSSGPKPRSHTLLPPAGSSAALSSPGSLCLPTHPGQPLSGLAVDSSKVLTSATAPLWLTWRGRDDTTVRCLFKVGDDLRRDALTLQLLTVMDNLWRQEGLNLNLTLYSCVPAGLDSGFIGAVAASTTTATIHKAASSFKIAGGAVSAFRKTALGNWLAEQNPSPAARDQAVERFIRSLAGYSVATYLLGVGDRHNDNIMITKQGSLFHIDFSNILGNVMKFGAYRRETAPFVLTPEFAHVMGGTGSPQWAEFVQLASQAFLILRRQRDLIITLFCLMLATGIPQLSRYEDLYYLRASFMVGKSEEEALQAFQRLIAESLENKRTQLNNAIHIFANPD